MRGGATPSRGALIHYYIPQYGYSPDELSCGFPAWKCFSYQKTRTLSEVTCHKCLEEIVREGDRAAERIIELDQVPEVTEP